MPGSLADESRFGGRSCATRALPAARLLAPRRSARGLPERTSLTGARRIAALARRRRKGFVGVVLTGTLLAIPIMVLGLFLPLIQLVKSF